jgi:acetoin utilization deacetylase AcuC-like enzyme
MAGCSAITDPLFRLHDNPGHPESQSRLENALLGVPADIPLYTPEPALLEDVRLIHNPFYLKWLKQRCAATQSVSYLDSDTYVTPYSCEVALHAAGAAISAAERSLRGEHCFALVRPPGHHAEHDRAMGFCLLNNAAIAAAYLLKSVDRVAIVDWDLHHGNGTQHAFYGSDRVLYCSTHQEFLFPYSGSVDETGTGAGEGTTVNAPLQTGCGIADYHRIYSEIFVPAIERFAPDAVIVSAGQDILADDPLGGMTIVPRDFEVLTSLVSGAAGIPLALVLEGGYGNSHGLAISHIFAALRQKGSRSYDSSGSPLESTTRTVSVLKKVHRLA